MSQEKTTLEIIAPSVDEAVEKGLDQLGLPQEEVEIEVLDSGSHGFLGLGSRQARIRLTIKQANQLLNREDDEQVHTTTNWSTPEPPASQLTTDNYTQDVPDDPTLKTACQVVSDLLEKMKVKARVSANYLETADDKDHQVIMVEIQGDDLSILIGRRSETLNALQYITSLIVGKEVGEWVPVMIDVQGYRARRERQLRLIARRIAEQAIHTGKRQVLEPMPANERRIIHLELKDHPQVFTESIGDEPNRKVTISLKK
jgi:spoIIIJ-associated protein